MAENQITGYIYLLAVAIKVGAVPPPENKVGLCRNKVGPCFSEKPPCFPAAARPGRPTACGRKKACTRGGAAGSVWG